MDRIHKELMARGIKHFYRCDNSNMVTSKDVTSCKCGFYVDRDMIQDAQEWAELYKENTRRIRTLLDHNPKTARNGGTLFSGTTYESLIIVPDKRSRKVYINPVLIAF